MKQQIPTHEHEYGTSTHTYIYMYAYICSCAGICSFTCFSIFYTATKSPPLKEKGYVPYTMSVYTYVCAYVCIYIRVCACMCVCVLSNPIATSVWMVCRIHPFHMYLKLHILSFLHPPAEKNFNMVKDNQHQSYVRTCTFVHIWLQFLSVCRNLPGSLKYNVHMSNICAYMYGCMLT